MTTKEPLYRGYSYPFPSRTWTLNNLFLEWIGILIVIKLKTDKNTAILYCKLIQGYQYLRREI